ncbi:MAG: hypothetical protein DHS20C07_19220 [Methyloligella sp.]|nr:MAG: hypothetical protein DHS20C07_19220 [Methyloligella sp.]
MQKLAFNVDEVSEMTSLSRGSVMKEIKEGRLISSRVGDRHLIKPEEIHKWLDKAKGKKLENTK